MCWRWGVLGVDGGVGMGGGVDGGVGMGGGVDGELMGWYGGCCGCGC